MACTPDYDAEKQVAHSIPHEMHSVSQGTVEGVGLFQSSGDNRMQRFVNNLSTTIGREARGIERVPEELRAANITFSNYLQMAVIWFSANASAKVMALGLLGPLAFQLGFVDSVLTCLFGSLTGALGAGYISTFGPVSGNRTLVVGRYTIGWWPSKVLVLLNLVTTLGYGMVDVMVSGQILSAVGNGNLSVVVGVIIAAIISFVIVVLGMKPFHQYERSELPHTPHQARNLMHG